MHYCTPCRALEVWGSWWKLDAELARRKVATEEMENRRKGLSKLITYLKKVNKDQGRRIQDKEVGCDTVGEYLY